MCKYCEQKNFLYKYGNKNEFSSLEFINVFIDNNTLNTIIENYDRDSYQDFNFKINYCPMCGRKLK